MRDPIETAELLAFTRIVEAKSLSRAAAELGIPRATVGRRLASLEERLGARLLRRTTRSLALTDAGESLYRHARIVLDAVAHAEASVRTRENVMRGDLRVSLPPFLDDSVRDTVTAFAKKHPDVRLQVDLSTRMIDLVRDGFDVALRVAPEIQPGLVARIVNRHRVIAVASPEYLSEHGTPRTVKDLRGHRFVTGFARGELPQATWTIGRTVLHVESAFSSNDLRLVRDAAVRGLGIALLPTTMLGNLIETGALVHILAGIVERESRFAVVYPERELLPPHVRAFVDALVEWAPQLQGTSPKAPLAAKRGQKRVSKVKHPSKLRKKA